MQNFYQHNEKWFATQEIMADKSVFFHRHIYIVGSETFKILLKTIICLNYARIYVITTVEP